MYFTQTLKVGDVVGIARHSYTARSNVTAATVTKTTKTTVTVEWKSAIREHKQVFNISNGRERGGNAWTADVLIPESELREAQARNRIANIQQAKMSRRDLALKRLQAANGAGDDKAFALALEALAQQEYAP